MEYHTLADPSMSISRFSLGTWGYSGAKIWGPSDDEEAVRTINLAIDLGVNLFDTAARYGDGKSEEVLGRAVKGRRDQVYLASKVHTALLGYDSVLAECEKSLRRLNTDYLDIFQIHWPSKVIPFDETLRAFEDLKRAGKIRAIGVCNHGVQCLEAVKGRAIVTNQLPYSLIWRLVEGPIVERSIAGGMAVWAYCPLAQGLLSGKYRRLEDVPLGRRETRFYSGKWKQGRHNDTGFEREIFSFLPRLREVSEDSGFTMAELALAFLRTRPFVGSILIGCRNRDQLRSNLRAFEAQVPEEVMRRVVTLSDALVPQMGTNPDLWEDADGGRMF
ncbi:MAG: aldo/keto reductase [Planctomycetes bacterium]|nr:aldo/keto reductase [Planctomycetota bacterium]